MSGHLYLTGFMGAGKTTVGRLLARALGRRFLDLDDLVVRRLGMPIPRAFAERGEAAFRAAERAALRGLARRARLVVATGGGLPLDPANRAAMRAGGRIVHLAAELATCRERLGAAGRDDRPLWRDPAAVAALYQGRQAALADCDLSLATDGRSPEAVVGDLLAALLPREEFAAPAEGVAVPVTATTQGPAELLPAAAGRRVAILCDHHLQRLHLPRYRAALGDPLVIAIPPGERHKSLATAQRVYGELIRAGLGRDDLLVALGGGLVTDLGAFVAATYKRGMGFRLVATSLLACVDAAVGGKAGVNLGGVKNAVGAFVRPEGVVLDLLALGTLPRAQRAEGFVEAYKTGLAAAPELAALCARERTALLGGDLPLLAEAAVLSARTKAGVVAGDFRESGRRRILNLGHTYGHAAESLSGYRLSHGRAVALGLLVMARLSRRRGLLSPGLAEEITATVAPLAPPPAAWPGAGAAWPVMQNDKKNRGGRVGFVLLAGPGQPLWVEDLAPAELAAALRDLKGAA